MTLNIPPKRWQCPSCGKVTVTVEARPHTPFHQCPALRGFSAPFVEANTRAEHRLVEREDYVGQEIVSVDADGRPVMQIVTVRDEGQDVTVFAPTAAARSNANRKD